jgi:hypothetical protein
MDCENTPGDNDAGVVHATNDFVRNVHWNTASPKRMAMYFVSANTPEHVTMVPP